MAFIIEVRRPHLPMPVRADLAVIATRAAPAAAARAAQSARV